jgi:hypothetical protein
VKRALVHPCLVFLGALALAPVPSAAQAPTSETQVAAAVLAAPPGRQAGARVLGFDSSGQLVTLRPGTNELVCLADDPTDETFSVACYHQSLEPYMARGRELAAQGISDGKERLEIRWKEAEEGALAMPKDPATLYVLSGTSYDPETGNVRDSYLRFVVYMPWATLESTGLSDAPMGPGSPWLMYPGTPGAHVMISPPRAPQGSRPQLPRP